METYFNIRYEFDRDSVHSSIVRAIETVTPCYICAADGNILSMVQHDRSYWQVIYDSLFCICDSGWVPLYLRYIHGIHRRQYSGAQLFKDIVSEGKYKMAFLGTDDVTLNKLRNTISSWHPRMSEMSYIALPFKNADEFDYPAIANRLNNQANDIMWVALGAPKQELFMNRLRPYLKRGVMIGVGAVFNYFSTQVKRAPQWMISCKLEFAYRILAEPGKQLARCKGILATLPIVFHLERERKRINRLAEQLESLKSVHVAYPASEVITAFGMSPKQLDVLLSTCSNHPETHFTIISDDARFWTLPANVDILPAVNASHASLPEPFFNEHEDIIPVPSEKNGIWNLKSNINH